MNLRVRLCDRRVDDVEGRANDSFTYDGGVLVHPLNFRSTWERSHASSSQVRQTERGADVSVCVDGLLDATKLGESSSGSFGGWEWDDRSSGSRWSRR